MTKRARSSALTGENGDGKEIVAACPDYIGKDCEVVVQELVEEIHEAGYFVEEVEGEGQAHRPGAGTWL